MMRADTSTYAFVRLRFCNIKSRVIVRKDNSFRIRYYVICL